MATTKVARSLTRSSTLAPAATAGADSERRIRAAEPNDLGLSEEGAQPLPPEVATAHRDLSRQSSHEIIAGIRRQMAELWWYGDRTLKEDFGAGISKNDARDAMADLVCQIGVDLNELGDEIDELAKRGEP